jgi:hypothetical protein
MNLGKLFCGTKKTKESWHEKREGSFNTLPVRMTMKMTRTNRACGRFSERGEGRSNRGGSDRSKQQVACGVSRRKRQ